MVKSFQDRDILKKSISLKIIDQKGKLEEADDQRGVLRDIISHSGMNSLRVTQQVTMKWFAVSAMISEVMTGKLSQ